MKLHCCPSSLHCVPDGISHNTESICRATVDPFRWMQSHRLRVRGEAAWSRLSSSCTGMLHRWDKGHKCKTTTDKPFGIIDKWQQGAQRSHGSETNAGKIKGSNWMSVGSCRPRWTSVRCRQLRGCSPRMLWPGAVTTLVSLLLPQRCPHMMALCNTICAAVHPAEEQRSRQLHAYEMCSYFSPSLPAKFSLCSIDNVNAVTKCEDQTFKQPLSKITVMNIQAQSLQNLLPKKKQKKPSLGQTVQWLQEVLWFMTIYYCCLFQDMQGAESQHITQANKQKKACNQFCAIVALTMRAGLRNKLQRTVDNESQAVMSWIWL